MTSMSVTFNRRHSGPSLRPWLGLLLLCLGLPSGLRAEDPNGSEPYRKATEIRSLTVEQARQHHPVKLRGVITFVDENLFLRFIQDDTAGIYFYPMTTAANNPALTAGQEVEIEGDADPGEFAPVVQPRAITVLGPGRFPPAQPATYEQLTSGEEDSQFVEIHGVVCSVKFDPELKYNSIEITTGGGRLTALVAELPGTNSEALVDSTVMIRGVCSSRFNSQRQLFDIRLLLPHATDLVVESPAQSDPFAIAPHPISQLLQFAPHRPQGHRVKVAGTVIYRRDETMYIQDETEGLYVETRQDGAALPGDRVEVLGFPARGEYTPMLKDAIFRKTGAGSLPAPVPVTVDEALKGKFDCRLVRIEATVVDRARYSPDEFLVLQSGGFIFHAYLERKVSGVDFAYLQNGSQVAVAGVCRIELGGDWRAGADGHAKSFNLLLRSPGDITVLARPPWWNFQRMLWAAGLLAAVMLTALAWAAVLRRRVHKQTAIIRRQLQTEATLKQRYENLFENANDMVFTVDLTGQITSINQTGEQLLQRPRDQIIGRPLADFMAAESRAVAGQWLEQVMEDADGPATEWDFLNAAGQRLKLEISSRLIGRDKAAIEIEGIARDITERRRLERELLEISNREQRRIGHDLHDGVCQQLAAIAYLVDILGDHLQAKNQPEHAEAERIGTLINEANTQARNVARGLFPARLDESGLQLALEEFAAGAASRFRIRCSFVCTVPPAKLDGGMDLHLYYIVQEALLNAVNHGKSTEVIITLAAEADRWKLTVQDNGTGFQTAVKGRSGLGIRIMKYRAKVIGATLNLHSELQRGTRIECVFNPSFRENQK